MADESSVANMLVNVIRLVFFKNVPQGYIESTFL